MLAHELRNPLAPIRNGLQVIRMTDNETVVKKVEDMMERQINHMVRLIDDLLMFHVSVRARLSCARKRSNYPISLNWRLKKAAVR